VTLDGGDRRDTPLGRKLTNEIATMGPIGVDAFVRRCLTDPAHGYYTTRSGIGRDGDFTTAPEISQVFGELIGLWAAVTWQQMGSPAKFNLVELGPGRGVLLDDALRAARILPGFLDAVDLHLCEINPTFRRLQADRLTAHKVNPTWHDGWPAPVPVAPTIIIANEFLDTIPGNLWRRGAEGDWSALAVGLDGQSKLTFVPQPGSPAFSVGNLPAAEPDAIFTHTDYSDLANGLAVTAAMAPLAALFIDYGHSATALGDTLQAVRNHKPEHPLASPGEADLSFAVDFAVFHSASKGVGLSCYGPVTQAEFLGQLGIAERASRLMSANPARANNIESGVYRLMASPGMGTRFKVAAVRSPGTQPLAGFAS
jgi:NADH dehydrogenase [ubiquinone] 1 alpha subcomplex assembly factor 7